MSDMDELFALNAALHGLRGVDDEYTFYYDETNNIRKFHVNADGFNVAEVKVFVLGGIAHRGAPHPINVQSLRSALSIQKSTSEIKLKHLASGDFLEILKSPKLTVFLQWLTKSQFIVHYTALDPLFWSVVDIVDSILSGLEADHLYQYHTLLKGDLIAILREDLPGTTELFYSCGYPDISAESRQKFLEGLVFLVEAQSVVPVFNAQMLKGLIQSGRSLESLDFIEGNVPHLLIESFAGFYSYRILTFKNSVHILDMEARIKVAFLENPPSRNEVDTVNYRFENSEKEARIQVSDILVGLLGKMFSYFVDTSPEEITEDRDALSGNSLINACLLRDLIDASSSISDAFLHYVASTHDVAKLDMFLRFRDVDYAQGENECA